MSGIMLDPDAVAFGQHGPPGEGQSENPDDPLTPNPNIAAQGPALSEMAEENAQAERAGRVLEALAYANYLRREVDQVVRFPFDANGDVKVLLYTSPAGNVSKLTRAVIDVQGFTPASPYTNAAAWAALYAIPGISTLIPPYAGGASANEHDADVGAMLDFAPATSGGPLFPGLFEYNEASAPRIRGGVSFVLFVKGTAALASKQGAAYIRVVDSVQV